MTSTRNESLSNIKNFTNGSKPVRFKSSKLSILSQGFEAVTLAVSGHRVGLVREANPVLQPGQPDPDQALPQDAEGRDLHPADGQSRSAGKRLRLS